MAIISLHTLQTKLRIAFVVTCCVALAVQHERHSTCDFSVPKCMGYRACRGVSWRDATSGIWAKATAVSWVDKRMEFKVCQL